MKLPMRVELLLELRNERERVRVIQRVDQPHPELGMAHPTEDTRRADLPSHWGWDVHAVRQEPPAAIEEPLPTRTQTILSHRVPDNVRRAINGDITDASPSSRKCGIELKLKL
ncbi:hypothetical protein [Lysobacter brunescens]|uniref:Uncharacterized protein n=1 Tax=Lysobacter brunescens TaxID=262323 RepID=A0ABW2YI61_9GAMM